MTKCELKTKKKKKENGNCNVVNFATMEAPRMAVCDFQSTRRFTALTSTSAGSGSEKEVLLN